MLWMEVPRTKGICVTFRTLRGGEIFYFGSSPGICMVQNLLAIRV